MDKYVEQQLRGLRLRCKKPVSHLLAGQYRSVFKGRGMEFEELRDYVFGDDVRSIDWKAMARTGRPYVRRYTEEREQSVMLLVDVSASGSFGSGSRTKQSFLHEIASLLAWSAAYNSDRVGLLLFAESVELYIPPARGRKHVMRLVTSMLAHRAKTRGTNIRTAVEYLSHVSCKSGIVFLLSDFQDEGYAWPLRVLAQRHDVTAVCVQDAAERTPPRVGIVGLHATETGECQWVDTDAIDPGTDTDAASALGAACRGAGIDSLSMTPQDDGVARLSAYFKERHRRLLDETGG